VRMAHCFVRRGYYRHLWMRFARSPIRYRHVPSQVVSRKNCLSIRVHILRRW
jgi:hypothetical protein